MILKICPYCQTENPENANFCKKCGASFISSRKETDKSAEKAKSRHRFIFAGGAILFVIALAVIMRGTGDKTEVITEAPDTTVTTTAESTTAATTAPAPNANATTAPSSTVTTTVPTTTQAVTSATAPAVLTTEEICEQYNNAISMLKETTENITIHKTEKINLEITHFSLPVPTETINSFMMKLIPETDITYNFVNGIANEDKSVKIIGFIPPASGFPAVTADDLLSAEKDANGTLTLKFKADSSSFANGQTVFPRYVDSATDVLDFATFSLGPVKIVKADIQYPATEIKAELDTAGQLKKLIIIQPVTVMSTGGVGSLTADVGMNLKATTTYEVK